MIDFLATLPNWLWIVGGIILVFIFFGDRGLWDYEVEFPFEEGIGEGEIDFKEYKKQGKLIEVELKLDSQFIDKPIQIQLNGKEVFSIDKKDNQKSKIYFNP